MSPQAAFFLFLCCAALFSKGYTEASRTEDMVAEVDAIFRTLELRYAPLGWKKSTVGWELPSEVTKAKEALTALIEPSQKDFHRVLRRLFKGACDLHLEVYFHSTECSLLPFRIAMSQGRCFVIAVNKSLPNYPTVPVDIGDEILSFDGLTPLEALCRFEKEEMYVYGEEVNHLIAEKFLTRRVGTLGHRIPKGEVAVTFRRSPSQHIEECRALWQYYPERIAHRYESKLDDDYEPPLTVGLPLYEAMMPLERLYPELAYASRGHVDDPLLPGDGFGFLGNDITYAEAALERASQAKILARLQLSHGKAILFEVGSRRYGYLRIPHYYCVYEQSAELAKVIAFFERESDGLVIDQTNNPGGYLFYMYAVVSMLSPYPIKTHAHHQMVMHSDVAAAWKKIDELSPIDSDKAAVDKFGITINGLTVDLDLVTAFKKYNRFIIDEWERGVWMTTPMPLMGIEYIKPHPTVHYTKPIVFLVNGLSFSCGDLMPAMLQDSGRALILGTKTPGAGGIVVSTSYPSRYGVSRYTYTGSFGLRHDLTPIENNGVTPDILYAPTPEDFTNNYCGYFEAILKALERLQG